MEAIKRDMRGLKWARDGVEEVPREEFESEWNVFPARVSKGSNYVYVPIPKAVVDALELRRGDWVLVALKRPSFWELREYIELVPRKIRRQGIPATLVQCPVCGRPGLYRVRFSKKKGVVVASVYHPDTRTRCYVKSMSIF